MARHCRHNDSRMILTAQENLQGRQCPSGIACTDRVGQVEQIIRPSVIHNVRHELSGDRDRLRRNAVILTALAYADLFNFCGGAPE